MALKKKTKSKKEEALSVLDFMIVVGFAGGGGGVGLGLSRTGVCAMYSELDLFA